MAENREERKLVAVMFTDMVGYTALVQQDEQKTLSKIDIHREILSRATAKFGGEVVQFYGDGSLSIYDSVINAVKCAVEIQIEYIKKDISIRIGIHLGDVAIRQGTVFGDGVNLASRIQAMGSAGTVLFSEKVRKEIFNRSDLKYQSMGLFDLKNVREKVEIFAVDHPEIFFPKRLGSKKKSRKLKLGSYLGIGALAIIFLITNFRTELSRFWDSLTVDEPIERLAVPDFENFTGDSSLNIISKMASHFITSGLIETGDIAVASYETSNSSNFVASAATNGGSFQQTTGATKIIKGSFIPWGNDSLSFSAYVINWETGEAITDFGEAERCAIGQHHIALSNLLSKIKGYWAARTEKVFSLPKFEAYEAYLNGKDLWIDQREKAWTMMKKAMELDPSFLDPHFYLFHYYFDSGNYEAADSVVQNLNARSSNLSQRQRNQLNYHQADLNGQNILAYNYYQTEYAVDPYNIFANVEMMVLAMEYMNDPVKTLEYMNMIPNETIDFNTCEYCILRLHEGMLANLRLGKLRDADRLEEYYPTRMKNRFYYSGLVKLYAYLSDKDAIDNLIQRAAKNPDLGNSYTYLYFAALKEFKLLGDEALAREYGLKTIETYGPEPSRTLARAYNLIGEYATSLNMFNDILKTNPDHIGNLGQRGVLQAKLGLFDDARNTIIDLESRKGKFDFGQVSYFQARIFAQMSRNEEAISYLQLALNDGAKFYPLTRFQSDPDLHLALKDDPHYLALIRNPLTDEE